MRGKSVAFQAAQPVPRVSRTAPAGLLLLQHARSGFGEAGHALGAAFLCQRVTALAGQLAIGQCLFASLGERNQGATAESEFATSASDDETLNPAPGSGRLDEEVQPIAVSVSSHSG